MQKFYLECLKMIAKSLRPSSLAITRISFVIAVLALLSWIVTNRLSLPDISQTVSFWVFVTGLIVVVALSPYMVWKRDTDRLKQELASLSQLRELRRLQENTPRDYIFPYIRTVNAYSVIFSGENYLSINVCFPSALNTDLELNTLAGKFVINRISLDLKPKSIKIFKHAVSNISDWHVDLTKQALDLIKKAHAQNAPVHVALELTDTINREYRWSVQEWTTLLLTKVN